MRSELLQREIDDLVAQGWRIEEETPDRVVMVDREFGSIASHVIVAILTFWWTVGLGNVVWGAYNYVSNSRRQVLWERRRPCPECGTRVVEDATYCPSCGTDLESESETAPDESGEGVVCPECEAIVSEGARYCQACGANLADARGPAGYSSD